MGKTENSGKPGRHRISVTTQVILTVLLLVLPINIISVLFARQSQNAALRQGEEAARHTAELYMNELDERISQADRFLAGEVDSNVYILKLRNHTAGTDYIKEANFLWQEMNDRARNYLEADAYFFYLGNEEYCNVAVKTKLATKTGKSEIKSYLSEKCSGEYSRAWFLDVIGTEKWLIHIMRVEGVYLGAMINANQIEGMVEDKLMLQDAVAYVAASEGDTEPEGAMESRQLAIPSSRMGYSMYLVLDKGEMLQQIPLWYQIGLAAAVLFILTIPAIVGVVRRILIVPLSGLNRAMGELEGGNVDFQLSGGAQNRETEELYLKFNSMAEQLKTLRIQVYEQELEKKDIEATNLRLQVNPHFILNCLNNIFSLAKSGNMENIKKFTKYLANYLRHSLWHTSGNVMIGEELRCVEDFISIQKIRFPNAFTYISNVDDQLMEKEIPSLLILNFVENSIKYGLKMDSEIEIIVIVRQEEENIVISVCDTGNGMDEERLCGIRSGNILGDSMGKHIGIWNCRRRLAMLYGEAAYFEVTSAPGEGTQVFIRIPCG